MLAVSKSGGVCCPERNSCPNPTTSNTIRHKNLMCCHILVCHYLHDFCIPLTPALLMKSVERLDILLKYGVPPLNLISSLNESP